MTFFFIGIYTLTLNAQTGPAGVGNSDGSDGQPENVIWYDANSLSLSDTDPVSTWDDLSGNGNDAIQGTGTARPLYRTAQINGLPAVVFDGTNDFMPFNGSLIINSDYTVIFVGKRQTNSAFKVFLGGTTSSANQNLHLYWFNSTQFRAHHYGNDLQTDMVANTETYSGGTDVTEFGIFTTLLSSSDVTDQRRNYQNNSFLGSRNNTAQLSSYNGAAMGRYTTGYHDIDAAELIIYSNALNDAQLQILYEYLGEKYGITIDNDLYNPIASYVYDIVGIGEEANGQHSETNSAGLYLTALGGLNVGDYIFTSHNNLTNNSANFRTGAEVTNAGVDSAYNRLWYIDTEGTPEAQLAFDFDEALDDGLNPTNISNYVLLYRAGTTGDFSIVKNADGVKNGDQVYFNLTSADLNTGYYTLGTENASESPLEGVAGRTWYTLISGNWGDWEVWTLDPSGSLPNNPDHYTPSTSPSNTADNVVILTGRTVDVDTSNNLTHSSILIEGRLDLHTTSGHSFGTIRGTGRVLMAADNFPSGDASHFYTKGQGEGTVEYYGGSYNLSTAREFFDVEIELDNAANNVTLLNDYTINGNLTITTGELQINDDTDNQLINLSVGGNVLVAADAKISVGEGNPYAINGYTIGGGVLPADYHNMYHQFNIFGNFTNRGIVRLTNLDAPMYDSLAINGAVTVRFQGASNAEINLYNTTDFYNLVIDKGTDKTYKANLYSDNINYFRLFGANSVGRSEAGVYTSEDPQIRKALFIYHGTLQLRGNIYIPTLSEGMDVGGNGDYAVGKNARLWLDGSNVTVYSTASSVDQITGFTSGDPNPATGVNSASSNQAMSVYGEFKISDGTFGTRNSAGFIFWAASNAQIKIEGGDVNVAQMRSANGATGIASYIQTGGTVLARGNETEAGEYTGAYPLFGLESDNAVFNMSDGEIILRDEDGDDDPEWYIPCAEGNYSVTGGKVTINVRDTRTVQVYSTANFWDLEINNSTGSGNMIVELDTTLIVSNDLIINDDCTLETTDPTLAIDHDIYVGRNFSIMEGSTYNYGTNTTIFDGTEDGELYIGCTLVNNGYEQYFNNFTVDKPVGKTLLLKGDVQKEAGTVTTLYFSRLIQVTGDFILKSGTFNQGEHSMRLFGTVEIQENGKLGVYIPGTTETNASIVFRGDGLTVQSEEGAQIGNFKMDVVTPATHEISFTSDMEIVRMGYTDGKINMGKYNLKIDYLHDGYDTDNLSINDAGINSSNGAFYWDGNSSDGGLSILITEDETYGFPVGVAGKYTPAVADIASFADTGYVTVVPVDHYLWTLTGGSASVLDYYWNIDHEDFTVNPDVYWTFHYDNGDVGGAENSYRAARIINYKIIEELGNWSVTAGADEFYFADDANPHDPIPLIAGDYTVGNPSVFNSTVRTLYARKHGVWHDYTTWSTTPDGSSPLTNVNQLPEPGDICVIGSSTNNYSVAVDNSHADYAPIDIAMLSILRYGGGESSLITVGQNGADCNFGFVTNRDPDAADPESTADHASKIIISGPDLPSGDFGEFLTAENTLWTYSRAFPGSNAAIDDGSGGTLSNVFYPSYTVGNTITEYPTLQFEYDGYSAGYIELPDVDITVHGDLRMFKGDHHLIFNNAANGDLTVEKDFEFNEGGTFNIEFQATGNTRTLTVNGNINFDNEPTTQFSVENAASTLVHTIKLQEDVINPSASSAFNGYNGAGNAAISFEFFGDSTSIFADMTTVPDFYQLIMNKGTGQSITATVNSEISLGSDPSSKSNLKPIQLQNGTLILNNTNIDVDISTGDENFKIPSTSCLQLTQGTVNVYGDDNGIRLDGKLLIDGGTVDMISGAGNGNNFIEYSASGSATIEISSGNLWIGSQIRRSLITEEGILSFTQSGGEVQLGVNDGGDDERSIFEILNTGSTFTHSAGDFYIVNDYRGGASIASMYFDPEIPDLTSGTEIQFGHTTTTAGNGDFTLYSGKDLMNLSVNSTNSPTLTLDVVSLTLEEDLTINANAEFDANGLDLILYGNFINNGLFNSSQNNTYFIGTNAQQITGATTFWNFHKTTTNTLTLNNDIDVENELHLDAGILDDGDNTLSAQGNVWMDITHTYGGTSNGILLNGNAEQVLEGNGIFGKLSINNSFDVSLPPGSEFIINNALQLEAGVLDIGKNLLILNLNADIIEQNPFSESNMIQTNISFTDAGVKKYFPAIEPADNYNFIYPLGSEGKYTPVELLIDSVGAGGYIRIKGANERHPTIINDTEPCNEIVDTANVLKYHWLMEANGISGFDATATMKYYIEDYQETSAFYDVTHYIAARLLWGSTLWNKYDQASFDEGNTLLRFSFENDDDEGVSGDYTAGIEDQGGTCEGAIPDEVPAYISISDGNWTDGTIWDTYPVSGGFVPANGPRGAIAIVEHEVTIPSNYILNYKTTINSTGLLKVGTTFGHRLGIVEGTGTLQLERGDMPAGIYDDFFSRSGGTIEFTGNTDYDVLSEVTHVRNLKFTGTGERRLPNLDFEVYGLLTIAGDDVFLEVINEHDRDMTLDSNVVFTQGSYDAGFDPSTVIMNGTSNQTITGDFTDPNEFMNFEINNSQGVTLLGDVEVDGVLNFISGIITTSSTNILTVDNDSETAVTNYNSSKYVDGPMIKLIKSGEDFIFPIGDDGRYGELILTTATASSADYWEAEYYDANPHLHIPSLDTSSRAASLEMVSGNEYWRIDGPEATSSSEVTIRWDGQSQLPAMSSDADRETNLKLVEWSGAQWDVVGSDVNDVSVNEGTIKSDASRTLEEHYYTIGTEEAVPLATATFTSTDTTICSDGSASLVVALTGTANWEIDVSVDGGLVTTYIANSSPYTLTPAVTAAGTYSITAVRDVNGTVPGTVFGSDVVLTVITVPNSTYSITPAVPTSYCTGDPGVAVGLDDSDLGVTYQLLLDGNPSGAPVAGDGAAITFGDRTVAGTYTVEATDDLDVSASCSEIMAGTLVISIDPLPVVNDQTPAVCSNVGGENASAIVDLTLLETSINNDGGVTYTWYSDIGLSDNITATANAQTIAKTINGGAFSDTEDFYCLVTNSATGCSDVATVTYTLYRTPETGPQYHINSNWGN